MGCAGPSKEYIREYLPVHDPAPTEYLQDCPIPDPPLETNGDLARGYMARGQALEDCNGDKESLREWAANREAMDRALQEKAKSPSVVNWPLLWDKILHPAACAGDCFAHPSPDQGATQSP